eukprot:CAMPEP_0194036260 /NCGR_PEP_ID=MMETSP0009_2-20130614/8615_1 /TAXON_ID=210454 /ORGANISM="Grammatophora oceanica, Strain CCMP 410" /LENGTH=222 /DNA_ID=CAMNT_0038677933 /DNA_START=40 /DNA_END=708 /DNA_ORIENTATION=+
MTQGTVAVFGATGSTGKYFVKKALEADYKVKVLVRSPDKLGEIKDHDHLTVIEGSFTDAEKVKETVTGTTYVVSMAGAKMGGKKEDYPQDMMLNFVKALVPVMEEVHTKCFIYQAGAFSPFPGKKLGMFSGFARATVGTMMMGIGPNVEDNDNVVKFLGSDECKKVPTIVTHPAALTDKPGNKELQLVDSPPMSSITFEDLATLTLASLKNEEAYGKNFYVS